MILSGSPLAADDSPWGRAQSEAVDYAPQKVVYDVAVDSAEALEHVLDRVSYLNVLYQADPFASSLVMVLHGNEIDFFAIENYAKHGELMQRAQSLTLNGPIEFRICKLAAESRGYAASDLHGFVQVVPMADAEIIRLQREQGYAYMQ
jgi:intracellular sulfur oxidation DsrE/DsrF family protein